jgi:hypothetical protein
MNLEERLQSIIDEYNSSSEADGESHIYKSIKDWKFSPDRIDSLERQPTVYSILREIEGAELSECLTSPYSFVRDYKLSRKKSNAS